MIITPEGEIAERNMAEQSGKIYAIPVNKRPLPDLATSASLPLVLAYAFNSNGDVESAYREWRGAIEKIPQSGALDNPKIDFSFMFDKQNLKSFDVALNSIRLMASQDIPGKGKRKALANQALAEAQVARERFRAGKYKLQKNVTRAYSEIAYNDGLLALTSETLRLLHQAEEAALHRFHGMNEESLADLRKIEVEIQNVESESRSLYIMRRALVAELNGALNRPPSSVFGRITLPDIREPSESDEDLFIMAVENNPGLAALRKEVEARGAAVVLAELEKNPDYSISGGIEQLLTPVLEFGITLPINRQRIRAGIAESLAMRQAAEARLRAAESDVKARLVISLSSLSDANRILNDYQNRIIPLAKELLNTQLTEYGSGEGNFLDIIDTERLLVDFKKLILRARVDKLKYFSEIEEITGKDLFRF